MTKFNYQTALITGASSGIGKAFAYELAKKGIKNLILTARNEEKLIEISADLKEKYKINIKYIIADLSDISSSQKIYNEIKKDNIFVDLLINNAGVGKWTNFLEQTIDTYQKMLMLNINSLVQLSQLFLPDMLINKKGGIINIASTGALQPCPYISVYCASKAFVLNFSESLYGEYIDKGIVVTAICPGNTETNFQKTANANTKGMKSASPDVVANQSINALIHHNNNKIIGFNNQLQSILPRILPRKVIINLVKNMMIKKVN